MLAGRVFGLYQALLESRLWVPGSKIESGQVLTERIGRRLALAGLYFDLFHPPFRFYDDTTVSDEAWEDDVRESKEGWKAYRTLALADGTCVMVREIQAEDAPALQRLVGRLSERTIRLRYFGSMKRLSDDMAQRFAEVDGKDRFALVALDPEDETRRVLAVTKNNLAAPVPALAFRLVPDDVRGCARIEWDGETTHTAAQLLITGDAEERSAGDEAVLFLTELLEGGPVMVKKVRQAARDAGIADRTLDRARKRAGVESKRQGFGAEGLWFWSLSATDTPKDAIERRSQSVASNGALSADVASNGADVLRLAFPGTEDEA